MAAPHSDTDDMITELVKDHRELQEMFAAITTTRSDHRRAELATAIVTELVRHSVAEEQYLYPTARQVLEDGDEVADREIAEHAEVERLLKRLEALEPGDAAFMPVVREVVRDVGHHLTEEEGDLFPRLQKACSPEQLRELGDRIRLAKRTAPTHPHPSAPDRPPLNRVLGPVQGLVDRTRDRLAGRSTD